MYHLLTYSSPSTPTTNHSVINIALLMMKQNKSYGPLTPDVQSQVSMMAIVGALTGQVFFGVLGDQVNIYV
jgi:hypothetical protein